jgi:hypothetical protein
MSKLHFKFRARTTDSDRRHVLSELAARGARAVEPLFPKDGDEELSTLYTAQTADADAQKRLIEFLNTAPAVEYAEPEVKRRLIR